MHPFHTKINPLVFTEADYYRFLNDYVGPEQVSPHYESLSRSRRGALFFWMYISTLVTLTKYGGWLNSDWAREMVFKQEFIICWFFCWVETRHFYMFFGPKFSVFYNVYTNYEAKQLMAQWADSVEEMQL